MRGGVATLGFVPYGSKTMPYKVLKGFILANGFEGRVDDIVIDKTFSSKEIASLTKDGSIEKAKLGSGTASAKKPAKPAKKKTK